MIRTPDTVSFSGADNRTDLSELLRISREWPQVEWGILLMPEKMHESRYPSWLFIERLGPMGMNTAVHLCGQYIFNDLLAEHTRNVALYHIKMFGKIQVNINARTEHFTPEQVMKIYDVLYSTGRKLILQYHSQSAETIKTWIKNRPQLDHSKLILLYDSSKGKGVTPDSWPEPLNEFELTLKRRFAGGIKPDNVLPQIAKICEVPMVIETGYDIDLESGARNEDNLFDPGICESMLKAIYQPPVVESRE